MMEADAPVSTSMPNSTWFSIVRLQLVEVLAAPGCDISGPHIRAVEPLRLRGELPGSLVSIDSFVVELSFVSFAMRSLAAWSGRL